MTKKKEKLDPKAQAMELLKKEREKRKAEKQIEIYHQIATRDIIERDFKEDTIPITFETAPNVKRTVLARRPTHKEMLKLMKLFTEASITQTKNDPESFRRMLEIIKDFASMAASFTVDESLDEEFWSEHVSFTILQNFMTELINQSITGGQLTAEQIKSFR